MEHTSEFSEAKGKQRQESQPAGRLGWIFENLGRLDKTFQKCICNISYKVGDQIYYTDGLRKSTEVIHNDYGSYRNLKLTFLVYCI